jgi:hypothetical protein
MIKFERGCPKCNPEEWNIVREGKLTEDPNPYCVLIPQDVYDGLLSAKHNYEYKIQELKRALGL